MIKDRDNVDQLAKSIMEGTSVSTGLSSKSVAEQIAEKLNMKLNYTKQENVLENDADNFKVFEEELEINDFPQQVMLAKLFLIFFCCLKKKFFD